MGETSTALTGFTMAVSSGYISTATRLVLLLLLSVSGRADVLDEVAGQLMKEAGFDNESGKNGQTCSQGDVPHGACPHDGAMCPYDGPQYLKCVHDKWLPMPCAPGTMFDLASRSCASPHDLHNAPDVHHEVEVAEPPAAVPSSIQDDSGLDMPPYGHSRLVGFIDFPPAGQPPYSPGEAYVPAPYLAGQPPAQPAHQVPVHQEAPVYQDVKLPPPPPKPAPSEDGLITEHSASMICEIGTYRALKGNPKYYEQCVLSGSDSSQWMKRLCPPGMVADANPVELPCRFPLDFLPLSKKKEYDNSQNQVIKDDTSNSFRSPWIFKPQKATPLAVPNNKPKPASSSHGLPQQNQPSFVAYTPPKPVRQNPQTRQNPQAPSNQGFSQSQWQSSSSFQRVNQQPRQQVQQPPRPVQQPVYVHQPEQPHQPVQPAYNEDHQDPHIDTRPIYEVEQPPYNVHNLDEPEYNVDQSHSGRQGSVFSESDLATFLQGRLDNRNQVKQPQTPAKPPVKFQPVDPREVGITNQIKVPAVNVITQIITKPAPTAKIEVTTPITIKPFPTQPIPKITLPTKVTPTTVISNIVKVPDIKVPSQILKPPKVPNYLDGADFMKILQELAAKYVDNADKVLNDKPTTASGTSNNIVDSATNAKEGATNADSDAENTGDANSVSVDDGAGRQAPIPEADAINDGESKAPAESTNADATDVVDDPNVNGAPADDFNGPDASQLILDLQNGRYELPFVLDMEQLVLWPKDVTAGGEKTKDDIAKHDNPFYLLKLPNSVASRNAEALSDAGLPA